MMSRISIIMLRQLACRALRLAFKTVIVVAGHKCLPQLPYFVPFYYCLYFGLGLLMEAADEIRKITETVFKNVVSAFFLIYSADTGQRIHRTRFCTTHAMVTGILF